ncbi:unnamed protein product [[Candida] boidinii]|nr:unnamed protein product [[Candida] boidinii]GMF98085.1 unnamed protein product [[Candida] boidinii]
MEWIADIQYHPIVWERKPLATYQDVIFKSSYGDMFITTSKITSYEDTPLKEFERNSIIPCIMIILNESKLLYSMSHLRALNKL